MGNFFSGLFRGLVITLLGTTVVYIAFFAVMAPKLPKDAAGVKDFLSELVNVKATVSRFQNKSVNYLESKEVQGALESDTVPVDGPALDISGTAQVAQLKFEIAELKKKIELLEKKCAEPVPTVELGN